jgi:exosortase K
MNRLLAWAPHRGSWKTIAVMVMTIALVICIKLFYSNASAADLKFVLLPTATLVKIFTSVGFHFDAAKGYVANGVPVVIGPGCAGLNFYVIALSMCVFSFIDRVYKRKLFWFIGLILSTYVITLFVNAFRIVGGIMLLDVGNKLNFDGSGELHSVQGTLFYFVFLIAYFVAMREIMNQRSRNEDIH